MRPSAKLWLEERKRQMNMLPPEDELRMRELKKRLHLGSGVEVPAASAPVERCGAPSFTAHATSSLLEQNVALLAYTTELEQINRQNEQRRLEQRDQLHEAFDENRRCAMQLIALELNSRKTELLLEEKLFRERVFASESDARAQYAWAFIRIYLGVNSSSTIKSKQTGRAVTLSNTKEFYA